VSVPLQEKPVCIDVLPYRRGVGIALFNKEGLVLIAKRRKSVRSWQMPQGGLDRRESEMEAAYRELYEEVGVPREAVRLLGEMPETVFYDLPEKFVGKAWHGRYRGQEQRWFAMRLIADDDVVRLDLHHFQEFDDWRWEKLENLPSLIGAFKRPMYERIVSDFQKYAVRGE